MPRMIWPTRFQRRLRHCTEDAQREKVEEDERNRQINRLLELLGKTGLLKEDTRREGAASAWMTRRRAMGRRASTLRAHIRLGIRMREFTVGCLDSDWFGNVGDLMDYIAGRLEEPCGRSVPLSIVAAVRFLEAAAEVPMEKRLSENPILQNFMSEISKSGWWATRTRTSANRLLLAVVFCWEFLVMEESQRAYIRLFAWFKLVKLWAMLRWNDTMGIPAARLQYVKKKGLVGEIVRSKTTGIGRRIEVQQFSVAEEAWFLAEGWLREGYKLFEAFGREGGLERRDFMMARPNSTLSGFRSSMVSYADAMAMSRTLLTELVAPAKTGGELAKLVLSNETGSFWSEHSERVTMASWSAALGIQQEVIKRWGRWRPSVDEEYVKTTQILVTKAQAEVARRVKSEGLKTDLVGEEEVISQVEERLRERGVAEEIIKKQSKRFRFYRLAYRESMEGAVESGEKDEADAEVTSMAGSAVEPFDFEELEAESEQPLSVVGMGTFVMSIVGRSKRRTLHRVGSCYRTLVSTTATMWSLGMIDQPSFKVRSCVVAALERRTRRFRKAKLRWFLHRSRPPRICCRLIQTMNRMVRTDGEKVCGKKKGWVLESVGVFKVLGFSVGLSVELWLVGSVCCGACFGGDDSICCVGSRLGSIRVVPPQKSDWRARGGRDIGGVRRRREDRR